MKKYLNEQQTTELVENFDPSGVILSFCLKASDDLQAMKDLYDALFDQHFRLEKPAKAATEAAEEAELENEMRIARTLMGLFIEKAKKVKREARIGHEGLEKLLHAMKKG